MWIKIDEKYLERLREIVAREETNKALAAVALGELGLDTTEGGAAERRLLSAIERPVDIEAMVMDMRDESALKVDYFSTRAGADRHGGSFHRGRLSAAEEILYMIRREAP